MSDDEEDDDPFGIDAWQNKCESNEWRLEEDPTYKRLWTKRRSIKTTNDQLAVEWMKYRNACRTMEWIHHKKWNYEEPVPDIASGVSDEELLNLIGEAFGIWGGCSLDDHYWYEEKGGANPYSRIRDAKTHPDWRTVKVLKGAELVKEVRALIGIPQPVPDGQMSLFTEVIP